MEAPIVAARVKIAVAHVAMSPHTTAEGQNTLRRWHPRHLVKEPRRRRVLHVLRAPLLCPCGLGEPYPDCCGRFHDGSDTPATAESLMLSRYSAFAVRDAAYLLRSWHLLTRPHRVEFDPQQRWLRLEVVDTADGGLFDRQERWTSCPLRQWRATRARA